MSDTIKIKPIFNAFLRIFAFLLVLSIMCQLGYKLYSYSMVTPEHIHDFRFVNSDSYNHWQQCECGAIINEAKHSFVRDTSSQYHWNYCDCGRVQGYTAHQFSVWNNIIEATENSEGLRDCSCTVCDYYISEIIPPIVHVHSYSDEWLWDELNHWKECDCGVKQEEGSHNYEEWEVTQEATIYAPGMKESVCEDCLLVKFETIPQLHHTHSFSTNYKKDESQHWYVCVCGEKSNVASHSYGSWETTIAATIDSAGEQKRYCKECGYTETKIIPKIPHTHSYTTVWFNDENGHWHQCSSCRAKVNYSVHTYGEWTTINSSISTETIQMRRVCSVCNYWHIVEVKND